MSPRTHEADPGVAVDAQAVEDGRVNRGDRATLVAADEASGVVDQGEIFVERDRRCDGAALGPVDAAAPRRSTDQIRR